MHDPSTLPAASAGAVTARTDAKHADAGGDARPRAAGAGAGVDLDVGGDGGARAGAAMAPEVTAEVTAEVRAGRAEVADIADVGAAIDAALATLLADQRADGHWVYPLEADVTIPAEYVLMVHYLGETPDARREARIARYLRRRQGSHGGWPLFHGGGYDASASVKAYFALKMIGDAPDAPHMARARAAILARGGAERSNVFTRMLLALYGQVPWAAVPVMPAEIALLPGWFPFHLSKVSYWTRTVLAPLLVLGALKPRASNPRGVGVQELFAGGPGAAGRLRLAPRAAHQGRVWYAWFRAVETGVRALDARAPARLRARSLARAGAWVRTRLNGEHGLGAIFPAMVNAVLMLDALGARGDRAAGAELAAARAALDRLLVEDGGTGDDKGGDEGGDEGETWCQPCLSPVWDTALMCHALLEADTPAARAAARRGLDWLAPRQVLGRRGDWTERRGRTRPGGWPFQYENALYPDVDDTAVVAMAMERFDASAWLGLAGPHGVQAPRYRDAVARAREWVLGMQSRGGGWGAFDADNTHAYLNNIPFADHGALIDPPTADVTARCLSMLGQLDPAVRAGRSAPARRALRWLLRRQESDGSWYGRWGVNYVYGTWSALAALNAAGMAPDAEPVRRAAAWLAAVQNPDGGWGEDASSYKLDYGGHEPAPSTASQTAWALLGLMAAGAAADPAVGRGIRWLLARRRADGLWDEPQHTATGFARVFYLRYHGYARYFPLWALARYRNHIERPGMAPRAGM